MKYKKGTFLIIPNRYDLHGKPPEMQVLYFWLCSFANEEGACFPSRPTLAKACNFSSLRTVDKYIDMLVNEGFIGKTKRKRKGGKSYISNLYQVRVLNAPRSATDDTTPSAPDSTRTISNINYNNLSTSTNVDPEKESVFKEKEIPLEFNYENELKKLSESKWKPDKIIALFWMRKKWKFENAKQFKSERSRQLKPARALEGYSSKQLTKAFEYCEDNYSKYPWGLETVLKVIAKAINE